LNNPAGSANAQIIPDETVEAGAKDLAMRAAKLMGRQISGVDLIKNSKTGKWFILETNSAPQLRSGSFLPQKREALAKFIDAELKR
jgi:D-alanine-D-alanine ligase-like ATP-grasp enzyme